MKNSLLQVLGTLGLGTGYLCLLGCEETVHSHDHVTAPAEVIHNHPSEGPHDGSLVELGDEEYHAELIHDEAAGTITIYLLDSSAKLAVPIEATEVLVNISHDGNAEQFTLVAAAQVADPTGWSSAFVSDDVELISDLDSEDVAAQLVVTIAGKQYRGKIKHGHEGHDAHAHEGDHDGDHAEDQDHDARAEEGQHDEELEVEEHREE